jgi:hypothetical protein
MKAYTPPLMPQYNDPGWFQSAEFGHQYYLEMPAYEDPDALDSYSPRYRQQDVTRVMQWYMSAVPEVDAETGFYSIFDGQHIPLRLKSPGWHNYHVWCDRFKAAFDPKGLSNPPQPYDVDEVVKAHPEFVTASAQKAMDRLARPPGA